MKLDYNDTLLMSREKDLIRLLAIALHKLGGSMEIEAEDYFSIKDKAYACLMLVSWLFGFLTHGLIVHQQTSVRTDNG